MTSMKEIWTQLAGQLGETGWDGQALRLQHEDHVVTLDLHVALEGKASEVTTRIRAAYANPEGFRFRIVRRSLASDIAAWFGAQDVEVGHPGFDRAFVVRTSDPHRVEAIFAGGDLCARLLASPARCVEVRDDEGWFGDAFPKGIDELCMEAEGRITDPQSLESLYGLTADLLDRVLRSRSAV